MADVYLVERSDGHFDKRGALKVLRSGMFGGDVRERFARERQVLADLDHPEIVRLLDGGVTEDGRPYLVMEYVNGVRITGYASRLPRADRLELFLRVCEAVAYAHRHGVVHRDLKPANILVTPEGAPRVLDFGIAKLVQPELPGDGHGDATVTRCFTPEYGSPEQIRGEPVTQACDVHGLGLLLYEILLGRSPFQVASLPEYEAARVVCEQVPDVADLPPRLAAIVAKAVRKKPAERYADVRDFAAAIRQYLSAPGWQRLTRRGARGAWMAAALLAAAVGAAALLRSAWRFLPETPFRPRVSQVTNFPGMENGPDLSPDGLSIVFSRDFGGSLGLWVGALSDGVGPQPLTGSLDCCARWSPDGKRIAFTRLVGPDFRDVILMEARGGSPRKVGTTPAMNISWYADGKALGILDRDADGPFRVSRLDLETGALTALTAPPAGYWGDVELAFSPDGRKLAFVRYASKGDGDLYVMPASGGEPVRLTSEHAWINGVAWTPDSAHIVFPSTHPRNGKSGLWRIPADAKTGAEPALVRGTDDGVPSRPAIAGHFAGGGIRLVFQVEKWHPKLWRMELSEAQAKLPRQIEDWPSGEEQPAFAPDGKRIAFMSDRNTYRDVWVSEVDGANAVQITGLRSMETAWPRWSPDGSQISFVARLDGRRSIYLVGPGGGPVRRLAASGDDADVPAWSGDGRWIYFRSSRSGQHQIWKIPSDGQGEAVAVTKGGGVEAYESADGKYIFFLPGHDRAKLWRVPVDGGTEEELPGSPILKTGYWFPTEMGICFADVYDNVAGFEGQPFLRLLPAGGGPTQTLGRLTGRNAKDMAVRHDAGEIVWSRSEFSSDLYLLEGPAPRR
jgi:Tol biopolymer transport system component